MRSSEVDIPELSASGGDARPDLGGDGVHEDIASV